MTSLTERKPIRPSNSGHSLDNGHSLKTTTTLWNSIICDVRRTVVEYGHAEVHFPGL